MKQIEEWRCGACAYWRRRQRPRSVFDTDGECSSEQACGRAFFDNGAAVDNMNVTLEDFGCRFWSARPPAAPSAAAPRS